MYDIEQDVENVAIVLHNGHSCMSWKEAQVLARAALNASNAVKELRMAELSLERYKQMLKDAQEDAGEAEDALAFEKKRTYLIDRLGREIMVGNIVHWTDGGDDLSLEERIRCRWDRIAVVKKGVDTSFTVIDSPHKQTKENEYQFSYGNFTYKNTEKYLTIVAENEDDYHKKFNNAGECMAWVKQATPPIQKD